MEAINQHVISGYIGGFLKVPTMEISETPYINRFESGAQLILLSVASNLSRKTEGKWIKETIWRKIEFWGNDASFLGEYSQKGQFIVVQYEEFPNSWTDKTTGETRYGIKLKATNFSLPKNGGTKTQSESEDVFYDTEVAVTPPASKSKSKKTTAPTAPTAPTASESNGHDAELADIPY